MSPDSVRLGPTSSGALTTLTSATPGCCDSAAAYPPTLLIHGDADTDVPYSQSVQMAEALRRAGVQHELITVPGGGHGLGIQQYFREAATRPADDPVKRIYERVLAFLNAHLHP